MSITIESDLKEILARFESKLDRLDNKFESFQNKFENIQKDITELKLELQKDMTQLQVELATVKTKLDNVEAQVVDLKNTQRNQLWAIISLFGIAVIATLVRFVLTGLPNQNF